MKPASALQLFAFLLRPVVNVTIGCSVAFFGVHIRSGAKRIEPSRVEWARKTSKIVSHWMSTLLIEYEVKESVRGWAQLAFFTHGGFSSCRRRHRVPLNVPTE